MNIEITMPEQTMKNSDRQVQSKRERQIHNAAGIDQSGLVLRRNKVSLEQLQGLERACPVFQVHLRVPSFLNPWGFLQILRRFPCIRIL